MNRLAKKFEYKYPKPMENRPEMPAGPAPLDQGYWLISQQRGKKDENVGPFGSASDARTYAQKKGPPEEGYQGWYLVKSDGSIAKYVYDDTKYFQRTGAARHNVLYHHEATYNREYNARAPIISIRTPKPIISIRTPKPNISNLSATLNTIQAAIFDQDRYEWYTFKGPQTSLSFRGQPVEINPGDKFGARYQTSAPKRGEDKKVRIITEKMGPSRVMSVSERDAYALLSQSRKIS